MTAALNSLALPPRFWSMVEPDDGGCWRWLGSRNSKGYPCWSINSRAILAHRAAYAALVGPIPTGLTLDHLCRIKTCVNPAHLEPVTVAENIARAYQVHRTCRHGFTSCYRKNRVHGPTCPDCDEENARGAADLLAWLASTA